MVDECTIIEDPAGADDDSLDQTTGLLTPPGGDTTTVYSGKVLIYNSDRIGNQTTEGGRGFVERIYTARIPWDSPIPHVGAVLTVTSAAHDQRLVGRPLRVEEVLSRSALTSRDMVVEDRSTP